MRGISLAINRLFFDATYQRHDFILWPQRKHGIAIELVCKEAWLGFLNGVLVGVSAGLAMLVYASLDKNPSASR